MREGMKATTVLLLGFVTGFGTALVLGKGSVKPEMAHHVARAGEAIPEVEKVSAVEKVELRTGETISMPKTE